MISTISGGDDLNPFKEDGKHSMNFSVAKREF
jgi:hypothetical protein